MGRKVVIIGGGAVGLSSAYFLLKKGYEVQVLNCSQGDPSAASYGNAGMIVPSHFIPLAAPGVVRQGLKWMLDATSPFYIKPRLDLELADWLFKFYQSSTAENVSRSSRLLYNLNLQSRMLFEVMEGDLKKHKNIDYRQDGLLMLYKTDKYRSEEVQMAEKAVAMGLDVSVLNRDQVQKYTSGYTADVLGGVLYKTDAHLSPDYFMEALKQFLLVKGCEIVEGQKVDGFLKNSKGRVTGVKCQDKEWNADEVIVSSGAWSGKLLKALNVKLPLQGGKGYSTTIEKPQIQLKTPVILCEKKIAVTPMGKRLRVAGTMEIAGDDLSINPKRVGAIQKSMQAYFLEFDPEWLQTSEVWAGLRPVSPDGLPYIGKLNKHKNVTVCTGHAMMGLSLAPISGKLVEEIVSNSTLNLPIVNLHPERFVS